MCSYSFGRLIKQKQKQSLRFSVFLNQPHSMFNMFSYLELDTRTHVVGELYDTEKSYLESLQMLVNKYMKPLKSPEYSHLVDSNLVDLIFYQIPEILKHHEDFLEILKQRLTNWDTKQKIGDVFVEAFTKQPIIDTYTAFINNWKIAKEALRSAIQAKPAFARYLENMSREHKGKLSLDAILIMPVQRVPRYELLLKELIKHTNVDHPDYQLLFLGLKEVHELAMKINRMEREAFEQEQMSQKVKDIEHYIEGVIDLSSTDRTFIRFDFVSIPGGLGTKKERCLFLFSDLLLITSIKKKGGATRKFSSASSSPSPLAALEGNKYKYLTRFPLEAIDITRGNDGNLRKTIKEIDNLKEDLNTLNQINDLMGNLNCSHQTLDEALKDLINNVTKHLNEKQTSDSQLLSLELQVTSPSEVVDNLTIMFPSTEKRSTWESALTEAKKRLAMSSNQKLPPEFLLSLPIRKTRAGLQFTCASPTLRYNQYNLKDIWICNSDGYVGQVCILTLHPTPTVASCNGVCNSRILCVTAIPSMTTNNNCYPVSLRRSYVSEEPLSLSETSGLEGTETEVATNCSILTSTCSTPSLSNLSSASIQSSPPPSSNSFLVISSSVNNRPESLSATSTSTTTSPSRSLTPTPSTKSKQSTTTTNYNQNDIVGGGSGGGNGGGGGDCPSSHRSIGGRSSSSQFQLDSGSSDDETESSPTEEQQPSSSDLNSLRLPPPPPPSTTETSQSPVDSCHSIDSETNQPTMWLGTEDGYIYIYNCNENIRIRKNKQKIQLPATVYCIIYLDNSVYSGLSNGQIVVFQRDGNNGNWSTSDHKLYTIDSGPIQKILPVAGKLWCSVANQVKVLSTSTLEVEKCLVINSDSDKIVLGMVSSGLGVWISSQGSSILKLYHGTSYECLLETDVAPAVTRMLATCDEIIRQHKAACLRITALLACKDLLWIGTSAGTIMTLSSPLITPSTTSVDVSSPNVSGIPHGHTGHVRFLTTVEVPSSIQLTPKATTSSASQSMVSSASSHHHHHHHHHDSPYDLFHSNAKSFASPSKRPLSQPVATQSTSKVTKILVISGGDGYEDFSNFGHTDSVGRDDSTNHLLLWQV
ncbi:rho guanine nucleotide exchange factor 17-like isoform X5 [Panonychus citri]|uniref:rho guanine nucleotide exchange factor 17-like isoform X5 n=1 Tax=Panonychus citri TaxID=50023 RepID=UPI002306F9D0|nr:rho guanine nucleotide exchange factor 17-like isoform X5 [Panonychus citri]